MSKRTPSQEDADLKAAMLADTDPAPTPKPTPAKPGKPAKAKREVCAAEPVASSMREEQRNRVYNIIEPTNEALNIDIIDDKGNLTAQELKYISLHLTYGIPPLTALTLAGYPEYSDQHAYFVGRKIVKKYESQVGALDLFINLNYGPQEIARTIIDVAVNCPNQQIRLNAAALAAKAVGLLKEAIDAQPGVTIIIKGRDAEQHAQPGGREPAKIHKEQAITGPVALIK